MFLSIKNLGKISSADIEINGITVIAGENNTGKSTVGKTLYFIFNSFSKVSDKIDSERLSSISRAIELSYVNMDNRLRVRRFELNDLAELIMEKLSSHESSDTNTQKELLHSVLLSSPLIQNREENIDFDDIIDYIIEVANISDNEALVNILVNKMQVDFGMQLNNVYYPNIPSEITLRIKDTTVQISVIDDVSINVTNGLSLNTEAIFIDDPYAFDNLHYITPIRTTHHHIRYLSHREHLKSCLTRTETLSSIDEIVTTKKLGKALDKINSICAGDIVRKGPRSYVYKESNSEVALNVINISPGLKTFAIIKTLLQNGCIETNGTIILDEPEIHLHPEWQLVFVELIVLLQKEFNLHVLLTTHSPYFLFAIEVYSRKYGITNKCKYYLAENTDAKATISDVSDNIDLIYAKLARPLQDLENERYK
ncbi:MAG: ATP-binding protein [Defluviitaleaceae bacterium]|nr:ATP-binding protein [Defluviitaleaceae bacterium]